MRNPFLFGRHECYGMDTNSSNLRLVCLCLTLPMGAGIKSVMCFCKQEMNVTICAMHLSVISQDTQ